MIISEFKKLGGWIFAAIISAFLVSTAWAQDDSSSSSDSDAISREWLHWKMFSVHPHLAASATYDDNINLRHTNVQSDFFYTVSPGFSLLMGDPLSGEARTLTLDYTPSFIKFTDHPEYDAIDHSATLAGVLPFSKLTLGGRGSYQKASTPDLELGGRVDRSSFSGAFTAHYDYSPKTSFDANVGYNRTDYASDRYINSQEWTTGEWMNYELSPKLNLGLGVTLGKLDQGDRAPAQTYEQVLLRAIYTLAAKLDFNASVGGEWRQYDSFPTLTIRSNAIVRVRMKPSPSFAPVFTIGSSYRPRDGTTIRLDAYRRDQNSATLAGYNFTATGFTLGVSQRFLERFTASFGGNYNVSSYHFGSNTRGVHREDSYWGVNAGLDVSITARWIAGMAVLHRSGDSSDEFGTVFDDNQVALQTSYRF